MYTRTRVFQNGFVKETIEGTPKLIELFEGFYVSHSSDDEIRKHIVYEYSIDVRDNKIEIVTQDVKQVTWEELQNDKDNVLYDIHLAVKALAKIGYGLSSVELDNVYVDRRGIDFASEPLYKLGNLVHLSKRSSTDLTSFAKKLGFKTLPTMVPRPERLQMFTDRVAIEKQFTETYATDSFREPLISPVQTNHRVVTYPMTASIALQFLTLSHKWRRYEENVSEELKFFYEDAHNVFETNLIRNFPGVDKYVSTYQVQRRPDEWEDVMCVTAMVVPTLGICFHMGIFSKQNSGVHKISQHLHQGQVRNVLKVHPEIKYFVSNAQPTMRKILLDKFGYIDEGGCFFRSDPPVVYDIHERTLTVDKHTFDSELPAMQVCRVQFSGVNVSVASYPLMAKRVLT